MRQIKATLLVVLCLFFLGCSDEQDQITIDKLHQQLSTAKSANEKLVVEARDLKAKVDQLSAAVARLSDTPSARLQAIRQFVEKNDLQGARAGLDGLVAKYPKADQTLTATQVVEHFSDKVKAAQKQQELLKRLKFKAISPASTFGYAGLTFRTLKVSQTRRWISDSYGDEYHYADADRGTQFIELRVNISSNTSKDPNLFPVAVYKVSGSNLERLADFSYAFRRWGDYGSYLGNYGDSGNDFAKSKTVFFTLAAQVNDADLKVPLMVIASNEQCVERLNRDLAPAVMYLSLSCESLKQQLSLSDMAGEKYHVIKRINF